MPTTMSCCAIVSRYCRWPALFAWITRRSPGRMILYSPSAGRPSVPWASSATIRSTRRRALRNRDHVPQRPRAGEQHPHAIESDRDPAVRRRARTEAVDEKPEALLPLLVRQPELMKNLNLQVPIRDADRPRAKLVAVVDGVIVERPAGVGIAVEARAILGTRRRERMMGKDGLPGLGVR